MNLSQHENHDQTDPHNYKRKKKRSLNQRFKKKFKSFSKGNQFDQIEYEYFIRVFQLSRMFEGTHEEKITFANNALAQTVNKEVECSLNQLISRVIENLLPLASEEVLERFFEAFGVDLRPICNHEFASHVLQALMISATKHSLHESEDVKNEHTDTCKAWLLKVCKFLFNNIEEFLELKYANHTLRTAMYCLAGTPQLDSHSKQQENALTQGIDECPTSPPPEEFVRLLEEFYRKVSSLPEFQIFVESPLLSGYMQALLRSLKPVNFKKYKSLCKKILADCFSPKNPMDMTVMFSPTALPVLEVMVENSKGKLLTCIYDQLLKGRLPQMATAPVANITVRKFINKCNKPEMLSIYNQILKKMRPNLTQMLHIQELKVSEMVSELAPSFSKIIDSKNDAVLVSLCQACERLNIAQSNFVKGLQSVFKWKTDTTQLVPAVLSLTPLPLPQGKPLTPKLSGSLLIQYLLKFQKPIKVVESLLSYTPEQLSGLLCTVYGSHLTQAFFQSEHIVKESRLRLIKHLVGYYSVLAQSKIGSRSFDDIWAAAEPQSQVTIAQDLNSSYSSLISSPIGKFIASKVRLDDFRKLPTEKWQNNLQAAVRKKKMFASIIGNIS